MNVSRSLLRFALLGGFALGLTAAALRAELRWDQLETTIKVQSWMPQETVRFSFTNTGTKPVRILEVAPSCGCTVAQLDRTEFAPGERGEIKTEFHPGQRTGTVRIPIRVTTDSDPSTTTLTLVATITEPLQLGSRFLYWQHGEKRAVRTVKVSVAERDQVEIVGVECSNPSFLVEFSPIASDPARPEYEVRVTPPGEGIAYAAVIVRTKEGPSRLERFHSIVVRTF